MRVLVSRGTGNNQGLLISPFELSSLGLDSLVSVSRFTGNLFNHLTFSSIHFSLPMIHLNSGLFDIANYEFILELSILNHL